MRCKNPQELTGDPYDVHRMEHRRLGADVSQDPAVGEGSLSNPEVQFWRWQGAHWEPVGALFGDPDPDVNQDEKIIQFWLRPPSEGDPAPAGDYGISVQATTASGETIYGEWPLCLRGGASA